MDDKTSASPSDAEAAPAAGFDFDAGTTSRSKRPTEAHRRKKKNTVGPLAAAVACKVVMENGRLGNPSTSNRT